MGAIAQSTVLPYFAPLGLKAELVLLLVVSWSILRGTDEGVAWAITGGILLDLLSALPFGILTTALVVTSVSMSWLGGPLLRVNASLPLAMAPVATVVFDVLVMLLLETLGQRVDWPDLLVGVVLPLALLDTIIMVPIYAMLHGIHARLRPEIGW
ncbi:MAG: rod shape-determining protein MreD [Chloroflexi bacterium]|nr:rod shape-determining protein MreD [Chloroflexota bacterium]